MTAPGDSDEAGDTQRRGWAARVPRGVWAGGVWLGVIGAALVVLALVVGGVDGMLPIGSRTSVDPAAASDDQEDVGPYWYTRGEADALSAELAAAVEDSDWCVGWSIVLGGDVTVTGIPYDTGDTDGDDGLGTGLTTTTYDLGLDDELDDLGDYSYGGFGEHADVGSNLGPGESARGCGHWAEVAVVYEYTSSSSELQDNARFDVFADDDSVERALRGHPALQVSAEDLLHEDRGHNADDLIGNAVAALPLALAELGEIDPLSVEPVDAGSEGAVTFEDAEGEGGIDVLVANQTLLLVGALVVLSGLTLLCMAWGQVPARWFQPAKLSVGAPAPQAGWGRAWPGQSSQRPGSPRRALKEQMERAGQPGPSPVSPRRALKEQMRRADPSTERGEPS